MAESVITWNKCGGSLPPIGVPVLVAWDGTTRKSRAVHHSAMVRYVADDHFQSNYARAWDWFEYVNDCVCDWNDDNLPTHWALWPEFWSFECRTRENHRHNAKMEAWRQ